MGIISKTKEWRPTKTRCARNRKGEMRRTRNTLHTLVSNGSTGTSGTTHIPEKGQMDRQNRMAH